MAMSKAEHDRIELAVTMMLSYGVNEEAIEVIVNLLTNAVCNEIRLRLAINENDTT